MARLRAGFFALSVFLLAALALLLVRTMESLDREREIRHQTVASRVFDEAERELTDFLRQEEARPIDHYLPRLRSGATSPLAAAVPFPFIVGYFQIDADGSVRTPRPELSARLLRELRSLRVQSVDLFDAVQKKAQREAVQDELDTKRKNEALDAQIQRPGTTRKLGELRRQVPPSARQDGIRDDAGLAQEAAPREADAGSSYQMLEKLNRALQERKSFRSDSAKESFEQEQPAEAKVADAAATEAKPPAAPTTAPRRSRSSSGRRLAGAGAPAPEPLALAPAAVPERRKPAPAPGSADMDVPDVEDLKDALAEESAAAARLEPESDTEELKTRMARSALAGVRADSDRLILYRNVLVSGQPPFQQGLLLDLERLTQWLEARVLGESGLAEFIELDFGESGQASHAEQGSRIGGGEAFVYLHRFGEPFEALSARLSLTALPDEGGHRYVYTIALLLVVASTLGLWAIYRRVAVAVQFSERRSNFAAAVSHELKTPLTAIRMYAEMLRDGMVRDSAKRQEYYVTISAEAERLTRLIHNVLTFSRVEHRKAPLACATGDPEPALREVLHTLDPHARALGFELVLAVNGSLPAVPFDRDALQQVLFNLIDNALKYARECDRKEIHVQCAATDTELCIRVRDFGPGVAREHERHLFEAFYRGEDELTRRTQGTGIGLALVKGLAAQMNARVSARNHSEGGFEVELRLPRDTDARWANW